MFADGTQSIYLADMSGDGLTDFVRIRNGEVCYWPNLGYGRFGAKVTMDNAPWFDEPDQFDQRRIRLADIDGSGTTDIFYLHRDGVRIYFNQSGNRWSAADRDCRSFPRVDNLAVGAGARPAGQRHGLPGLVIAAARRCAAPMRYIDLMGGRKPHLLIKTVNNLGAETQYVRAVDQVLPGGQARRASPGLPGCRSRCTSSSGSRPTIASAATASSPAMPTTTAISTARSGSSAASAWSSRRTPRNSRPSQRSGELPPGDNIDAASHVPPVLTKTWFHTGVVPGGSACLGFFAGLLDGDDRGEYYREPGLTTMRAPDSSCCPTPSCRTGLRWKRSAKPAGRSRA